MRVDSGLSQLSMLQAQQAFTPAQRKPAQTEDAGLQGPVIENVRPDIKPPSGFSAPVEVDEIRDIARRAGYLDVSDTDIQRAYIYGESLLTDYSV